MADAVYSRRIDDLFHLFKSRQPPKLFINNGVITNEFELSIICSQRSGLPSKTHIYKAAKQLSSRWRFAA